MVGERVQDLVEILLNHERKRDDDVQPADADDGRYQLPTDSDASRTKRPCFNQ